MEEFLQGRDSYSEEELRQLADLGNNRIIFLMDRSHAGDDYVKALYCCGIYDGLYLDDAGPKEIMKLILNGRTNAQARNYYGIRILRDAEKDSGLVNEERLGEYLEYLEAGTDSGELGEKYRFVSGRLGAEENRVLAASLAAETAEGLRGNEVFGFYRGTGRGKRHLFPWRKKRGGSRWTNQCRRKVQKGRGRLKGRKRKKFQDLHQYRKMSRRQKMRYSAPLTVSGRLALAGRRSRGRNRSSRIC